MALTHILFALFDVLANLVFAGDIPTVNNQCWNMAMELSRCHFENSPVECICQFTFYGKDLIQLRDFCAQTNEVMLINYEVLCGNATDGHPVVQRDPVSTYTRDPLHAHGEGFCGLPGTFCASGDAGNAAEAKAEVPVVTDADADAPTLVRRNPDYTSYWTKGTLHATGDGYCGLPGTFCASGKESNGQRAVEVEAPVITDAPTLVPRHPETTSYWTKPSWHATGDGFCGLPGTFCANGNQGDDAELEARMEAQPGATPAPSLQKRDVDDPPLPIVNTRRLIHNNDVDSSAATAQAGWKFVVGFVIGVVGYLLMN